MIHKLHDKNKEARKRRIIRYIIGIVVFVILSTSGIFIWSGRIFTLFGRPLWKSQEALSTILDNSGYIVRTKASVYNENERLLKENVDLKNSMLDYTILKKENDQLKELMGRLPTKDTFILASILTKPNRSPYDTIIIDGGASAGMIEGEYVYANATVPIGEISKVYPKAALVVLYSNPGQTTEGVLDGSNASVELLGRGGGNFEMTIPTEVASEKGVYVVAPGRSLEILGIVDAVISAPTDPVKKVLLHSPINIQDLKWVQVKKD